MESIAGLVGFGTILPESRPDTGFFLMGAKKQ